MVTEANVRKEPKCLRHFPRQATGSEREAAREAVVDEDVVNDN